MTGGNGLGGEVVQGIAAIGKMFFWLALVGLLAYAVSRLLAQRAYGLARGRRLAVLESVSLGPRRHLCLVRVDDQVLCVGVTDKNITLLCRLGEEEATAAALVEDGAGAGHRGSGELPVPSWLPGLQPAGRFAQQLMAKGTAFMDHLRRGGGSRG